MKINRMEKSEVRVLKIVGLLFVTCGLILTIATIYFSKPFNEIPGWYDKYERQVQIESRYLVFFYISLICSGIGILKQNR